MYGLSNSENIFEPRWSLKVKRQGQTLKTLKSNISKTVRDREKVAIEVRQEVMYSLSNSDNIFDPMWPSKVKDQGQTLKLWNQISQKLYKIDSQKKADKKWCMGFWMAEIFWPQMIKVNDQGQTLKVKYLQNGTIWKENVRRR